MPKASNNNVTSTAPASLEAKIDAAADVLKQCLPELEDKIRGAQTASEHGRHARLCRLHRAAHDFVVSLPKPAAEIEDQKMPLIFTPSRPRILARSQVATPCMVRVHWPPKFGQGHHRQLCWRQQRRVRFNFKRQCRLHRIRDCRRTTACKPRPTVPMSAASRRAPAPSP